MTISRPHESEMPDDAISTRTDEWIRQFMKHLELQILDASRDLPQDASISESQAAAARAILATFVDGGMERESVLEMLGQAAMEWPSGDVAWSDALNRRRFELIDREIQENLTAAESVELAGLTSIMREHVESETNLPIIGARALHRKLRELESTGKSD